MSSLIPDQSLLLLKGGDASTHAEYVYGNASQQHAVSESSNQIAQLHDPASYVGGRKIRRSRNSMVIPTVLLVANTNCKTSKKSRKSRKGGKSRKSRKSRKGGKSRKSRKSKK